MLIFLNISPFRVCAFFVTEPKHSTDFSMKETNCRHELCFFEQTMRKHADEAMGVAQSALYERLSAGAGIYDSDGFCIFHSKDHAWQLGKIPPSFLRAYIEFCNASPLVDAIVIRDAHLTSRERKLDLAGLTIGKALRIAGSHFHDTVFFRNTRFDLIDWFNCKFLGESYFEDTHFDVQMRINDCEFFKDVRFNRAEFRSSESGNEYHSFNGCIFHEQANFPTMKFFGKNVHANFQNIHFKKITYFANSLFEGHFLFDGSHSDIKCDFTSTEFHKNVSMIERNGSPVQFNIVDMTNAKFFGHVNIIGMKASQSICDGMTIERGFNITNCKLDDCSFAEPGLGPNGILSFKGDQTHPVFEGGVSFVIDPGKIKGKINFNCVRLTNLPPAQLTPLQELQAVGQVEINDDCTVYFEREVMRFNTIRMNEHLTQQVIIQWRRWLKAFTETDNVEVALRSDEVTKTTKVILSWSSTADFKYIYHWTIYFFQYIFDAQPATIDQIFSEMAQSDVPEASLMSDVRKKHFSKILRYAAETIRKLIEHERELDWHLLQGQADETPPDSAETVVDIARDILSYLKEAGKNHKIELNYMKIKDIKITQRGGGTVNIAGPKALIQNNTSAEFYKELQKEVKKLRKNLKEEKNRPADFQQQLDNLKLLLEEAKASNKDGVLKKVRSVADWVLSRASDIGCEIIASGISNSLGY